MVGTSQRSLRFQRDQHTGMKPPSVFLAASVAMGSQVASSLAFGGGNSGDGWNTYRRHPSRPLSRGADEPSPEIAGRRRSLPEDSNRFWSAPDAHVPQKPGGDAACPCLSADGLEGLFPFAPAAPDGDDDWRLNLGYDLDPSSYGVGCAPHDVDRPHCSSAQDCANIVPLPPDCDRSWCLRSWCYVDPDRCDVLHKPSLFLAGRHFSYSTCGFMDSFTYTERLRSLRGRTFRVAFNSNSGGWRGAYNPGGSFAVNTAWDGPVVQFVRGAALEGGFSINVTTPPAWLRSESRKFFGSSSFDYCVYSVALGYIDMCVAAYTLSDKRASVTTFFETADDPVYLVTYSDARGVTWNSFSSALATIFQPFTLGSWLMIVLLCLPVLGLLMLWHEYAAPGSAYPKAVPVVEIDDATGRHRFKRRKVKLIKHVAASLYMSFLAACQESYNQSVVTVGGKINLLAISSFVLMVIAVYTANLAAILTSDVHKTPVSSIEEALLEGYNFCSSRRIAAIVMDLYQIPPDRVVPDPIELGGDGRPGFGCPDCDARTRIFDRMRKGHNDPSLYCDAALASLEDLEVLHAAGRHCDKTHVGDALASRTFGIPLRDAVSPGLLSLFMQMKNDGVIDKEMAAAQPESRCPVTEGEGNALSVEQLTGIWIVTFSFALAGIIAKLVMHRVVKKRTKAENAGQRARSLQRYDQWGNPSDHDVVIKGRHYDLDAIRESLWTKSSKNMTMSLKSTTSKVLNSNSVQEDQWQDETEEANSQTDGQRDVFAASHRISSHGDDTTKLEEVAASHQISSHGDDKTKLEEVGEASARSTGSNELSSTSLGIRQDKGPHATEEKFSTGTPENTFVAEPRRRVNSRIVSFYSGGASSREKEPYIECSHIGSCLSIE